MVRLSQSATSSAAFPKSQSTDGSSSSSSRRVHVFFVVLVISGALINTGLHNLHSSTWEETSWYATSRNDNSSYHTDTMIDVPQSIRTKAVEAGEADVANRSSIVTNHHSKQRMTTKIIGFSDEKYKEIAWNWYQQLTDLGYHEHMVIASDVPTENYCEEKGMRYDTIHPYGSNNFTTSITIDQCATTYDHTLPSQAKRNQLYRRRLFGSRWNYILRQLRQGMNILLTDVDNIFVRYVDVSELEQSSFDAFHAYAGTTEAFPRYIYRRLGFTICGGMSFLRGGSHGVLELVEAVVKQCGCESTLLCSCHCDDQVVWNNKLLVDEPYKVIWDDPNDDKVNTSTHNSLSSKKQSIKKWIIPQTEADINWESMTGTVSKTGHRVKIWDRHTAFRRKYDPNDMLCPDKNKSWIAMPSALDRMKVKEIWMKGCGGG